MSLDHLISWAMQGGPAPVELTDASVERITLASEYLRMAGRSGAVYGLTTGVGALRTVPTDITPGDGTSHALRLWRSHATGFGATYDDETARAAMAIRLHQITSGRSGVSAGLASSLGAAIAGGAVPDLHRFGSIGTGDLVPLAELGLTLVGERPWRSGGAPVAALDDGDALPFMSSNALTLATAALVHRRLALLSDAAEKVTALSAVALQASLQAYDPRVHAGRPDASQQGVARRLMALLDPADWVPARVQDPFALRTVPQVHAPFVDALVTTEHAVRVEVDDSTENPLVTVDGTPLHHGGFVTARLSATLDALRQATYPVIALSAARLSALINPSLTGLPAFLASGPAGSSGVMILEYLAQDALARARILTTPGLDRPRVGVAGPRGARELLHAGGVGERADGRAGPGRARLRADRRGARAADGPRPAAHDPRPRGVRRRGRRARRGAGRPPLHRRPRRRRTPGPKPASPGNPG